MKRAAHANSFVFMNNIFTVPQRNEVSAANQAIFDAVKKALGFVPNLYASFAYSEHALGTFMAAQGARTSLNNKEKEAVNLVVSQVNECAYCLSAHSATAKLNGFTDEQILEIRSGAITFDAKLDALIKLAKNIAENKGHVSPDVIDSFIAHGYTKENIIDTIMLVGIRTITNYIFAVTQPEIDFPAVSELK